MDKFDRFGPLALMVWLFIGGPLFAYGLHRGTDGWLAVGSVALCGPPSLAVAWLVGAMWVDAIRTALGRDK